MINEALFTIESSESSETKASTLSNSSIPLIPSTKIMLAAAIILLATWWPCTSYGADKTETPADPFAPTVTRKESELLKAAMASSNLTHAIQLLSSVDLAACSPALDFARGNIYFQSQDYDRAAVAYEAALKKMPLFRRAAMNLGRVYLLREQPEKTIAVYRNLVRDGQANADILLLLGHALLLREQPVSAENAYRQTLLLRPGDSDALAGLAKCLLRQERYREGMGLLKELLHSRPMDSELWMLRINALIAVDQPDKAVIAAETAVRLGLRSAEILTLLGDLYLHAEQPTDAVTRYLEAFKREKPSIPHLLRASEGLLILTRDKEAEILLHRAAELGKQGRLDHEQTTRLLRLSGELATLRGDQDRAMDLYRQLLERNPLSGDVLILLGNAYHDKKQLDQALMTFERASRLPGYEHRALIRQAQIEVERERYTHALELLEAAQVFEDHPHIARYLEQVRRLAAQQ